ncbi:MAG: hypothetical protein ACRELF_01835 [Gemmataceae bacterium]
MSIIGKILAIFNVFAVVGALALMTMSYAARQGWQHSVFVHELVIGGLPITKEDKDERQELVVDKISEKTRQDLFKQTSPTTPVATQKDELDRVQGQLRTQYQSAGDKPKQIAALAHILAPMADTIEQRQRMIAYQTHLRDDKTFAVLKDRLFAAHKAATAPVQGEAKPYEERFHDAIAAIFSDPPGPLAEEFLKANSKADPNKALAQSIDAQFTQLQSQFEQMFSDAIKGGEKGAPSEQKRAIARLLFNMVEVMTPAQPAQGDQAKLDLVNNPAYKRFIVVVGVKAALEAVNEQASILQDLALETETERMRQRSLFAVEHRKAVDLVRDKKTELDHLKVLYARKKQERETHLTTLENRKVDVEKYEEQLAAARLKTAKHLEDLRKLSNQLFLDRTKLRDNTEANQQLERDIRALEEGR